VGKHEGKKSISAHLIHIGKVVVDGKGEKRIQRREAARGGVLNIVGCRWKGRGQTQAGKRSETPIFGSRTGKIEKPKTKGGVKKRELGLGNVPGAMAHQGRQQCSLKVPERGEEIKQDP